VKNIEIYVEIILPCAGIPLQFWVIFHNKVGRGKWITQPMAIRVIKHALAKRKLRLLIACSRPDSFRWMVQIFPPLSVLLFMLLLDIASVIPDSSMRAINITYWIWADALFLDDWLSNTDKPKKWWSAAKNKIKWKMALPVPVPIA
jgi:hypothetical protein